MRKSSWMDHIPIWLIESTLFIIMSIVVIGLPLAIVLAWITYPRGEDVKPDTYGNDITIRTIDRHEYIIYDGHRAGGICHKEDCKSCKEE